MVAALRLADVRIPEILDRALAGCPESGLRRLEPRWDDPWVHLISPRAAPSQGWKLHLSATLASAEAVLGAALPILLDEGVAFKVAVSLDALDDLNEGRCGASQVGKFITVYPSNDAQAVRIASRLDGATDGLSGPRVPSDRRLGPGSAVFYRYGDFGGRVMQTALGELLPALRLPDGRLLPDRRAVAYQAPDGIGDPFVAAGVVRRAPKPTTVLVGRYLPVATLFRSPRGSVSLAIDSTDGSRCVLKRARAGDSTAMSGRDACDRLRHEAAVLRALAPDPCLPAVYDLVEYSDGIALVMEEFEGETLQHEVQQGLGFGRLPEGDQILDWARQIATILGRVHDRGWVYGDLKPANTIIAPGGHIRLVDFELAAPIGGREHRIGAGTRGFLSPQQDAGEPAVVADDIYSLGALLYFAATGAEPAHAPGRFDLLARPLRLMNPALPPVLAEGIQRCLAIRPADRFPSMDAFLVALQHARAGARVQPQKDVGAPESAPGNVRCRALDLAFRLGDTLCAVAEPRLDGAGVAWLSRHAVRTGMPYRDLGTGTAGALLALAEIADRSADTRHLETVHAGAVWLATSAPVNDPPLPGLYVGEAGVGAALLRAGQVLRDPSLIAAARERGRRIAELPHRSPDLYHGSAGRLRFHLLLWDESGDDQQRQAAIAAGEAILAAAEDAGGGALRWRIPAGYEGLSGVAHLGYGHGAAGIGDTLLDLYEVTSDARFLAGAQAAGAWLNRQALPALDDRTGRCWPAAEGEGPWSAMWCHGASGIGRFYLHAALLDAVPAALDMVLGAARTAAGGARWANPTQCHGLAGQIEFLVDAARVTGDRSLLTEAETLGALLFAFADERDGTLTWPSESPTVVSPDYMVGYAGVAVCLLRLADPAGVPHQLSREGFRFRHPPG